MLKHTRLRRTLRLATALLAIATVLVTASPAAAEVWAAVHNLNSNLCVDARNGNSANGTPIQQWGCNGTYAQQWSFQPTIPGYFRVENRNNPAEVWDVTNRSLVWGTPIQLWAWSVGANQQWGQIPTAQTGDYFLTSLASQSLPTRLCLEVTNGSLTPGAQLQQWGCNGSGAQTFQLGDGPFDTTNTTLNLNERSAPSTSAPILGSLPGGTKVLIACQKTGDSVKGSAIWDRLYSGTNGVKFGAYVSNAWVNTQNYAQFSPPIPQC